MLENSKLFDLKISELEKDTFYRQRFDACPHFMSFIGEAHTSVTNHSPFPYGQNSAYCRFSNDKADWYHSNSQLKITAETILQLLKKDKDFIKNLIALTQPKIELFYDACSTINKSYLSNLSNEDLQKEYEKLRTVYLDKLFISALIDGFSLVTDELLHTEIQSLAVRNTSIERSHELFEKVTAHNFISFLQEEELNLLKIRQECGDDDARAESLLQKHQQNYFWIRNNYVSDHVMDYDFFKKRYDELRGVDVGEKIVLIENTPKIRNAEKQKLFNEYDFPSDLINIIELTDVFNYFQDERKKSTLWATHFFSIFLKEVSDRVGFRLDNLRYSVPSELALILNKKLPEAELILRRGKGCIVLWYKDEYQIITDQIIIEKLDALTRQKIETTNFVKGFSASKGKVRGPVRIVESIQDIGKVILGDIMVSVMTRPDYLPGMEKAVAFVTDEGGITCHAAIVAREMNKPCVIATKNATKIFKDNDMVEVDADRGIVTKI